jgi:hypothetical protein
MEQMRAQHGARAEGIEIEHPHRRLLLAGRKHDQV